jgi:foldase protein PrsA
MKRLFATLLLCLPLASQAGEVIERIAAKVGSRIITSYEVDQAVAMMEASMSPAEAATAEGKKRLAEDHEKALDRMIEEKLVILAAEKGPEGYKEAVEKGTAPANPYLPAALEVDEELDKAFDEARARFPSQDQFEQQLKRERISVSEFRSSLRERIRSQMTFSRMVKNKEKEFQPGLRVSDEEAKAFYDEHKDGFAVGQQVNLRHILFKPGENSQAALVVKSLQASKNPKGDFVGLAKKYSQDELTADKGGRLGWIEKGGLRWKQVEEKAFSLKPGEVAGPIKSADGLHVILVEEQKEGEQKSFDEVKAQVRNRVYQQKIQKRIESWVEDLKREFFVEKSNG